MDECKALLEAMLAELVAVKSELQTIKIVLKGVS